MFLFSILLDRQGRRSRPGQSGFQPFRHESALGQVSTSSAMRIATIVVLFDDTPDYCSLIEALLLLYIYHFAWEDQRELQGNISYNALRTGQPRKVVAEGNIQPDITQENGFHLSSEPLFDTKL